MMVYWAPSNISTNSESLKLTLYNIRLMLPSSSCCRHCRCCYANCPRSFSKSWPILNILHKMSCALYSLSMCVVWRWHITVEINECQDEDHDILHGCLSDLPRAFSINNLVDVSWNFQPIFLTESSRQLLYWAINHGAAVDICARQCATLERSHRSPLTIFSSQNVKSDLFRVTYL